MRQPYPNELWHYGILGMKWGVRRYQNPDGTLTAEGKKRYRIEDINRGNPSWSISDLAKKIEKDDRSGKIDADAFIRSGMRKVSDEVLQRTAFDAINEVPYSKGYVKKMLERTSRLAYEEIANRNDLRAAEERGDIIRDKNDPKLVYDKRYGDEFFDKDNSLGWDHDGNPIYNKTPEQIAKERSSNPKLKNMTDGQYSRTEQDLLEISGDRYGRQPLVTRQKIIKDYYDTIKSTGRDDKTRTDEYMWDSFNSYGHGPRPTNQQALQNQYDSYLDLHPNSELTFNEFNNWFYEA